MWQIVGYGVYIDWADVFFNLWCAWDETLLKYFNIYVWADFFRGIRKIAKNDCNFVICVPPFVRQCETMDFHELGYLSIFRRCVEDTEISLKSYKNNRYFTRSIITRFISKGGFTVKPTNIKLHCLILSVVVTDCAYASGPLIWKCPFQRPDKHPCNVFTWSYIFEKWSKWRYRVGQKPLDDLNLAPCRHLCRWRS